MTHFYVRMSSHTEIKKGSAKTRCCHGSQVPVLQSLPRVNTSKPTQPLAFNTWLDPTCTSGSDAADPPQPGAQKGHFKEELG